MPSATTATPCACCEVLLAATLECRRRGGTATLCGFSEFTSPSSPPKKYLVKTFSGIFFICNYGNTTCSGSTTQTLRDDFSGVVCTYDPSGCTVSRSHDATRYVAGAGSACPLSGGSATSWGYSCPDSFPFTSDINTLSVGQTVRTVTGDGRCGIRGGASVKESGSITETLSSEDTEADALARLMAGGGGTWSSWGVAGALGCAQPACCTASYQHRTSGFTVGYQEAQFRVSYSGLAPTTSYNARVYIYRRAYGSSDPWVLYQTLTVTDVTDGSGAFLATGDVPNDAGYESYADSADIVTY